MTQPRRVPTHEAQACAVLQPAVAEAARRTGAATLALLDLVGGGTGSGTGLNLHLDRVATTYSDGRLLGDPASTVQVACRVVGERGVPPTPVPPVVARLAVGRPAVGPALPEDVTLLRGDAVALLPEALRRVPPDALPVVVSTWALSRLSPDRRGRFLESLRESGRTLAWVSVEGVGVAPTVPTLGDRPASGHSIVGLAVLDGSGSPPEAVARCWSRGRVLAWLAA